MPDVMIVARRDVRRERAKRVERSFAADFELLVHVFFDEVHRDMTRPFDHYLAIVLPRDSRQLAERFKLRKLCLVVRVRD